MNGLMKRYRESLARTPGPVLAKDIPDVRIDLRGLSTYAKERGVQPAELSDEEKRCFLSPAKTPVAT